MNKHSELSNIYKNLSWYHRADLFIFGVFLLARSKIMPQDRRVGQQFHLVNERRGRRSAPRLEKVIVFLLIQLVLGVQAFLLAAHSDSALGAWMFVSYFFALSSFIVYKSLTRMVGWVKAGVAARS
jgi:hypothetical protein